jgi:hypothetical protein
MKKNIKKLNVNLSAGEEYPERLLVTVSKAIDQKSP